MKDSAEKMELVFNGNDGGIDDVTIKKGALVISLEHREAYALMEALTNNLLRWEDKRRYAKIVVAYAKAKK